jgi:hypothetical protein
VRERAQPLDRQIGELVLLILNGEGITRVVLEVAKIKFGHKLADRPVPDPEERLDQPAANDLLDESKVLEHLQCRGMRGCRPWRVVDLAVSLEHVDRQTLAGQGKRCDKPNRAAASDENWRLGIWSHCASQGQNSSRMRPRPHTRSSMPLCRNASQ